MKSPWLFSSYAKEASSPELDAKTTVWPLINISLGAILTLLTDAKPLFLAPPEKQALTAITSGFI